jgi:hypothetical protein
MFLCYMDESGDPGVRNSPTLAYTVSALLVKDTSWASTLDILVNHRRWVKSNFGLAMRAEVKANELVTNRGPWGTLGIGEPRRKDLFRSFLRLQAKAGTFSTFAIVVLKAKYSSTDAVRERAWENALNRLEVFSRVNDDTIMMFPDVGEYEYRRKLARQMRRFAMVGSRLGGAPMPRPIVNMIEDPVSKKSHESYFIQLADLNAYAAHRRIVPVAGFPDLMWENLGSAINAEANKWSKGPAPGIVIRD